MSEDSPVPLGSRPFVHCPYLLLRLIPVSPPSTAAARHFWISWPQCSASPIAWRHTITRRERRITRSKISRVTGTPDNPVEHAFAYDNTFVREKAQGGPDRLKIGLRGGQVSGLRMLAALLRAPYKVLYVLHTSRTDAPLGRYESPGLELSDVERLFAAYGRFIEQDARHDVWLHTFDSGGPLVLDRYNMLYAYGPLDRFAESLAASGVREVASWAAPAIPSPNALHYHEEFDADEAKLLEALPWRRKHLKPEDVRFWSGPRSDEHPGTR